MPSSSKKFGIVVAFNASGAVVCVQLLHELRRCVVLSERVSFLPKSFISPHLRLISFLLLQSCGLNMNAHLNY